MTKNQTCDKRIRIRFFTLKWQSEIFKKMKEEQSFFVHVRIVVNITHIKTNSVCSAADYGGFTTEVSSVEECATACLQKFPLTRFIEYKPKSGLTPNDCDCDSSTLQTGGCDSLALNEWTVYFIGTINSTQLASPLTTSSPTSSPVEGMTLVSK